MGDSDLAIQAYQEVLRLQQQRFGFSHPDIARTLHAIGLIYDQMGNLTYALEYITNALSIQCNFQENDDDELQNNMSTTLTHAGYIFYRMDMISAAMKHFDYA